MKKVIAFSVCLCMILTLSGCGHKDDKVAGFEYYHYETQQLDKDIRNLDKLADTDKSKKIIKLYDHLYDQCIELDTLYTVAYIKHSTNMASEYYDKEQLYCYRILVDREDKICEACRKITRGPSADSFKEHVGDRAFEAFANYDEMTPREKKLVKQEQKLVNRYYDIYDKVDSEGVKYKGETWTLDDLMGDRGENLALSNYDAYSDIYYRISRKVNQKTGPIFIQLLKLRDELADINGYDNYADYADAESYNRDYTGEDLKALYQDCRKVSEKYNENYSAALYVGMEPSYPDMPTKNLLKYLDMYSGKVCKLAGKSSRMLLEENLYNIGEGEGRQNTSYTSYVFRTGKPYLCQTVDHDVDFATLTHEFGHFVQFSVNAPDNVLTDYQNMDLAEIASNGYQGLMTHYYDDIFGQYADSATRRALDDLLENVIEGCLMDEFQRKVYANPDMDLKEINRTYSRIQAQYDESYKGEPGYAWAFVPHNFENPMYYISYAASGLAALQIWNQSQTDFKGAAKTWEKITRIGVYNRQYLSVLDQCGLKKFTEKGATMEICKPALKATKVKVKN